MKTLTKTILALAIVSALSACGGGSDGTTTPVVTTPAETGMFKTPVNLFPYTGPGTGEAIYQASTFFTVQGDFNNDGLQDVLVTYAGIPVGVSGPHTRRPIKIFVNDGNGKFHDGTADLFNGPITTTELARENVVADFNGDGLPDVFFGDSSELNADSRTWGSADALMLSNANGKYEDKSSNVLLTTVHNVTGTSNHYTHGVSAGDYDLDGDVDLLINITTGAGTVIMINDGTGVFTESTTMGQSLTFNQFDPNNPTYENANGLASELFDANGDGLLDYATFSGDQYTGAGDTNQAVFLNDGNGNFNAIAKIALPATRLDGPPEDSHVTDIDGDGDLDLFIGDTSADFLSRAYQVLINDGSGNFTDETATRFPNTTLVGANNAFDFQMVDMNGDGVKDFFGLIGDVHTGKIEIHLNNNGIFEKVTDATIPAMTTVEIYDFDGDGDMDMFGRIQGRADVYYVEGNTIP